MNNIGTTLTVAEFKFDLSSFEIVPSLVLDNKVFKSISDSVLRVLAVKSVSSAVKRAVFCFEY